MDPSVDVIDSNSVLIGTKVLLEGEKEVDGWLSVLVCCKTLSVVPTSFSPAVETKLDSELVERRSEVNETVGKTAFVDNCGGVVIVLLVNSTGEFVAELVVC